MTPTHPHPNTYTHTHTQITPHTTHKQNKTKQIDIQSVLEVGNVFKSKGRVSAATLESLITRIDMKTKTRT